MDALNPYAPPTPEKKKAKKRRKGAERETTNVVRRGGHAIAPRFGAEFPDRCVVCNAAADGFRLKKTFSWHNPAVYLTVCLGFLIYLIAAAITRKSAVLELGLCELHQTKRKNGLTIAWGGAGGGIALLVLGSMIDSGGVILFGVFGGAVAAIAGSVIARAAGVHEITDETVILKVGDAFLDSLADE
jgi:hypothetical protein